MAWTYGSCWSICAGARFYRWDGDPGLLCAGHLNGTRWKLEWYNRGGVGAWSDNGCLSSHCVDESGADFTDYKESLSLLTD